MPLKLEIKRVMSARSDRVKCVDIHPTEPWVVAALYTGHIFLWNYQNETLIKTFKVSKVPVRTAKFVARKQWIVCGADDMNIRVYNYNTMEKLKTFEAHTDYIRCLAVHPTSPYLISASDDMTIKLWDWDRNWEEVCLFEGHTHYVMQLEINPKDLTTFASAALDHTVKVWGLNSNSPHFSLEGHERGVNCVSYYSGSDRPFLISGADDQTVRIWDYQTKACVAVLEGHSNNVSSVMFHPSLPIIISGSEDGTVRIWHSTTYRLENTLNYGMERVWTLSCLKDSNRIAIGYDEGTVMLQIGQEEPVVSMDRGGKIVWARNHEIIGANVKTVNFESVQDAEKLSVSTKEMGNCEIYPQSIVHDPKGRLLAVCGDGEYIIYTALSLNNKSYGSALEFVWASHASGVYATRESPSRVKIFKNFKETQQFKPNFPAETIFGGSLLGVRSSEFIDFYEWEECRIIRRIEVVPSKVYWSDSGDLAVLACESSYFVLRLNRALVNKFLEQRVQVSEQGIDDAFVFEKEVGEEIKSGSFVGDCFIYTNSNGRLNYYVGGEIITLAHLDKAYFVLGYIPKDNRVYLIDKQFNVVSYSLLLSVLVYQTAIVRGDIESASKTLGEIPVEHHNRLARFLEAQGLKEVAIEVSRDPEHRFELSLQLERLDLAYDIIRDDESEQKWKQLGDAALSHHDISLATECYEKSQDLGGLLLLSTSAGDEDGLSRLSDLALKNGRFNIAFVSSFLRHDLDSCIELLLKTNRIPEAAFFCKNLSSKQNIWHCQDVERLIERVSPSSGRSFG
eukprot:TRINITY_DN3582_c0_g1_i3.p1 TRINITY_DN3582_c0_g1~~TRINITY_DN3582_c0_g1_i3.p1  ORF type:complete len:791 (-),score=213.32 TRINITY_DN3582_c0_g1_i3:3401-5773(-)